MTVVLDPPSVVPPAEAPEAWDFPDSWVVGDESSGNTKFVDCELAEDPPPGLYSLLPDIDGATISLAAPGEYTITFSGSFKITAPVPAQRKRLIGSIELTAEMIEAGADLLERVGLYKSDLWPGARAEAGTSVAQSPYQEGQPVCAWGAVLISAGIGNLDAPVSIDEMLWDEHYVMHNMAVFNDDPIRVCSEVVEQLRHRARVLRQLQAA